MLTRLAWAHEDESRTVFGDASLSVMSGTRETAPTTSPAVGHFATVTRKTYFRDLTYCAGEYVALLATMSAHLALEDSVRDDAVRAHEAPDRGRRRLGQSNTARRAVRRYNRLSSTLAVARKPGVVDLEGRVLESESLA